MCSAHQKTKMGLYNFAIVSRLKRQMWVGSSSCLTNGCTFQEQPQQEQPQQREALVDLGHVPGKNKTYHNI